MTQHEKISQIFFQSGKDQIWLETVVWRGSDNNHQNGNIIADISVENNPAQIRAACLRLRRFEIFHRHWSSLRLQLARFDWLATSGDSDREGFFSSFFQSFFFLSFFLLSKLAWISLHLRGNWLIRSATATSGVKSLEATQGNGGFYCVNFTWQAEDSFTLVKTYDLKKKKIIILNLNYNLHCNEIL